MRLHRLLRNRAIGLARRALAPAATWRDARTPATLPLTDVQRRLELLLAAMFGRTLRVGAETPASGDARGTTADIVLPARIAAPNGLDAARERYRLLAIERAMRIVRGIAPREACRTAIAAPLTDDPDLLAAIDDLVEQTI